MEIKKGIQNKPILCVVYGPEGIGKTTFVSKFPKPLFIDIEGSTNQLDVDRIENPGSLPLLEKTIKDCHSLTGKYETIIIDTMDEKMFQEFVCQKHNKPNGILDFGWRNGFTAMAEELSRFLEKLTELRDKYGFNVCIVSHSKMRKMELPEESGRFDRWELDLVQELCAPIKKWADMVLFANYKILVTEVNKKNKAVGGKRTLYTSHNPCWDAKNRYKLKAEVEFDFASIAHCFPKNKEQIPSETVNPPTEKQVVTPEIYDCMTELMKLMDANSVSEQEIQNIVHMKNYYPADTNIHNYKEDFIKGVLIAKWDKVLEAIITVRNHK